MYKFFYDSCMCTCFDPLIISHQSTNFHSSPFENISRPQFQNMYFITNLVCRTWRHHLGEAIARDTFTKHVISGHKFSINKLLMLRNLWCQKYIFTRGWCLFCVNDFFKKKLYIKKRSLFYFILSKKAKEKEQQHVFLEMSRSFEIFFRTF